MRKNIIIFIFIICLKSSDLFLKNPIIKLLLLVYVNILLQFNWEIENFPEETCSNVIILYIFYEKLYTQQVEGTLHRDEH